MTAIEIYIMAAIGLAFIALFEYAILLYRIKSRFMKKVDPNGNSDPDDEFPSLKMDCKIDQVACIMYLVCLILFHIGYCIYFLTI